jgi:demethylmenaquinone methyltransferase / 2-methoxy-6-polyprenyl-1,4-benzoquinol methylase
MQVPSVGWSVVVEEPSKRADVVSGMFDRVAARYDRANAVMSAGNSALWRIATTRAVDPKPGERILDIAAGTGTSSASLARTGATVVAVDFSPGMIAEGRQRHPQIEFVEADAERLPFGDDEFDAVTISFGLRNVEHPEVALAEMYRVMKPGGRLVVCEFSKPPHPLARGAYDLYLRRLLPIVGAVSGSAPDSYEYLSRTIDTWPDQATLSQWIRGVGFTRVAHRNLTTGIVALHRGRKPVDAAVRASAARRRANRQRGAAD